MALLGAVRHVCKPETLREAYEMARRNGGAAGIDGVTFAAIEEAGLDSPWKKSVR